ncbi:hypothetical protein [Pseudomonas asiatica]|uniref:hypothetical protein n=1 Tax=Pseudomonas asiatica TaxID=2219225 RepID=UPI003B9F0757
MDIEAIRDSRAGLVNYMRSRLIGPAEGEFEEFEGSPLLRYMMGMLFPREGELDLADDGTEDVGLSTDDESDQTVGASHRAMPSSVGLSFLVAKGGTLKCNVSASIYERLESERGARSRRRGEMKWRRISVPSVGTEIVDVDLGQNARPLSVLGGRAEIHIQSRPWLDGANLLTVTLVNSMEKGGHGFDPEKVLFQIALSVDVVDGEFLPYPRPRSAAVSDQEEAEVRYLYRNSPVYARGHGASAMWDVRSEVKCSHVWVEFLPTAEVRAATFEVRASDSLDERFRDIEFLAFSDDVLEVQHVLTGLGEAFGEWLESEDILCRQFDEDAGSGLAEKCRLWQRRIKAGIESLSAPETFAAFTLANRAMYWQMLMAEQARAGVGTSMTGSVPRLERGKGYKWRPFQIAYFLGVIPSLLDGDQEDREVVDVIWFPTGGGKTEAYLLVAAFELIRRRIIYKDSDTASAVLSRYTLRMLTTQQFQRTGMLVCALELLRRDIPELLSNRPFSVGLWVGRSLTPNRFQKAMELFDEWSPAPEGVKNPFLLDRCPACATPIVNAATKEVGVDCGPAHFLFKCLSSKCDFHENIPMQIVDEALYREPPSILLGTLDKFAGLSWDERPRVFFGGIHDNAPPPSLIIQDELHLISGPLGSISAPYELAIDSIIRARGKGRGAKIIASTATIRNSQEQIRGIYGRKSTVFPSPIRSWDDAFFFRLEDPSQVPGRLYVGAMGQGATTPVVSMVWVTAALLQASAELRLPDVLRDAYWTVLAYVNSRRELGRTMTAASQEIPDRMKAIASVEDRVRAVDNVMELSSQMTTDMGEAIRNLERRGDKSQPAVDFVPCTSIISVGVDVDRLGLMLINGQPKLNSEYIQASSRVGRSRSAPGVVIALYSPAKPRDRSHYEDFLSYHESFYRFVEPTSVTPYAPPARKRTLHAAVIAMIRHATNYAANDQAGSVKFDEAEVVGLLESFRAHVRMADPSEASRVESEIDDIIERWKEQSESGRSVYYTCPGPQFVSISASLIRDFGDPPAFGMYEAMRSVRNVDPDVELTPVGRQ